ncbi:MAG: hypothetical protein QXD66_02785 [Candidatus Nezhaarchaeales archaeon]|nr:MAG: hypothetical protein DSO06_05635 [Candidatus Nezhaarchaeota archaeon WYZ-LMO8]TDA37197.1 MAG: hypothetical protein DSO05_01200 [Candidatus Nezhaarchaeota archaeon WYZ-LMO7]
MTAFLCGELFYDVEKVRVKVIKKVPEIKVGDEVLGPLDQNQEVEVERWIARVLKEEGYVDIIDERSVDLSLISKIAWKEVRTDQLVPLEPTFYVKARKYLKILNEKAKVNPEALNEKRAVEVKLTDVVNCRVQKIVSLALTGTQPPREVLDRLTPEEKVLFNEVRRLISRWRQAIRGEENG